MGVMVRAQTAAPMLSTMKLSSSWQQRTGGKGEAYLAVKGMMAVLLISMKDMYVCCLFVVVRWEIKGEVVVCG